MGYANIIDLCEKIANEGFDYFFYGYGFSDPELKFPQIEYAASEYIKARRKLIEVIEEEIGTYIEENLEA